MNRPYLKLLLGLVLLLPALACDLPITTKSQPTVAIVSPPSGTQVAFGQALEVQFHAEDDKAVAWVQMTADDKIVAAQKVPVAQGQTPFDGILRWAPPNVGTYTLLLTAHNTSGQASAPASLSVTVVDASAGLPAPPAGPASPQPGQPAQPPTGPTPPTKPPTPTPTATVPPPAQPKPPTPTPTATSIPPPEIVAFLSDKDVLHPGECATLQWTTRNAEEVYLNQYRVDCPAGTYKVCYDKLSPGINGFILWAVTSVDNVTDSLEIRVEPLQEAVLVPPLVSRLSGRVSQSGIVDPAISPGDDALNDNFIGFISFDISQLPSNATVTKAMLQLGNCTTVGNPFGNLAGQLFVVYLDYGDSLDSEDYNATGGEYLGTIYDCLSSTIDVTDSVNANKNRDLYQITLSWPVHSNFDGSIDTVSYTAPAMKIVYTTP